MYRLVTGSINGYVVREKVETRVFFFGKKARLKLDLTSLSPPPHPTPQNKCVLVLNSTFAEKKKICWKLNYHYWLVWVWILIYVFNMVDFNITPYNSWKIFNFRSCSVRNTLSELETDWTFDRFIKKKIIYLTKVHLVYNLFPFMSK